MPPASAVNNNNNNNNNAVNNAIKQERLRGALKIFIQKERQRKKEEFEAKVEEERLRKEREARERQNDMTLEETRGQIAKLDQKLTELRNQKQQLFLQLKKVLNEDENRKKLQKDNEMFAMQAQQANAPPPQVFLPPVRSDHHQMPILTKPSGNNPIKRGRSPSPPTHQVYFKATGYSQPKHDDQRRNADLARVLWNKPPTQYQSPGTLFYQTTSNVPPQQPPDTRGPAIIYNTYNLPLRQSYPIELQPTAAVPVSTKSEQQSQKPPPTQVYHINLDQPRTSQSGPAVSGPGNEPKKSITTKKIVDRYFELKMDGPPGLGGPPPPPPHHIHEAVYTSIIPPGIALHPNVMPIAGTQAQNSKSVASITQGYAPGRGQNTAHEQQMARQQPITVMQGQPGQPPQQALHYSRRLL